MPPLRRSSVGGLIQLGLAAACGSPRACFPEREPQTLGLTFFRLRPSGFRVAVGVFKGKGGLAAQGGYGVSVCQLRP
ncbi:hypothetical protein WG885_004414 [Yersinia enterocolitica]